MQTSKTIRLLRATSLVTSLSRLQAPTLAQLRSEVEKCIRGPPARRPARTSSLPLSHFSVGSSAFLNFRTGVYQLQRQLVSRQPGLCPLRQSDAHPAPGFTFFCISLFYLTFFVLPHAVQVTTGMNVVRELYSGYGDGAPSGNGPDQGLLQVA